jgi:hypothetical protein
MDPVTSTIAASPRTLASDRPRRRVRVACRIAAGGLASAFLVATFPAVSGAARPEPRKPAQPAVSKILSATVQRDSRGRILARHRP